MNSTIRQITIQGQVDSNNSTNTPILAGATFAGSATEIVNEGIVFVSVYSDVASATDGLLIQQSSDTINWDHEDVYTIPAGVGKNYSLNPHSRYYRVIYTNGGTDQTEFRLQSILKSQNSKPSSHRIKDTLSDNDDATLSVTIPKYRTAKDDYVSATATNSGNLKVSLEEYNGNVANGGLPINFSESGKLSPFGDLLINEPTPILQYAFEYTMTDNTRMWDKTETNGGVVGSGPSFDAMAVCDTSTTASSVAGIRSVRPIRYRSGFGSRIRFTTLFSTPAASCTQLVGAFGELGSTAKFKNGLGVGYNGTTFELKHFMNDMDVSVTYSDPTGFTLDPTKLNIWEIDFGYLGTGDIIYKVYDTGRNDFVEVHRMQRANTETVPHSYNPNYNFIVYTDNGATTSQVVAKSASMGYFVLGKTDYKENQVYDNGYQATLAGVTTQTQLFSIRNKSTYTSVANFIDLLLEDFSAQFEAPANARGIIELQLNPTLNGTPSWTDISTTDSIVEVDTAQTTVISSGQLLGTIYLAGSFDKENLVDLIAENKLINPGDEVAVLVQSTNNATFTSYLSWKELF